MSPRFSVHYPVYSTVIGTRSVDVVAAVADGATVTVDAVADSADAAYGSGR